MKSSSIAILLLVCACGQTEPEAEPASREASQGAEDTTSALPAETCSLDPAEDLVLPNATLEARPSEETLRVTFIFQGKRIAIHDVMGIHDRKSSDDPRKAGLDAGYWFELRDASERVLSTQVTHVTERNDGPEPLVPECEAKWTTAFFPNRSDGKVIVFLGSPYGKNEPAFEYGRFKLP